tara:strand:+ start:575 stop:895 length:321 start_codon:yes stop_codon:yes gene_type:complete
MKGEMTIDLGGEHYACRLTVDSLIKIETELDQGILAVTQRISEADVRLNDLAVILYYALRGGGKDLSQSDIKKIIQSAGVIPCTTAVAKLLVSVLSDPSAEETEKK